ncbi:disease resistance protein [Tanacetum coccineum]
MRSRLLIVISFLKYDIRCLYVSTLFLSNRFRLRFTNSIPPTLALAASIEGFDNPRVQQSQKGEGENAWELELVGRDIVNKCKGLPQAVKTLDNGILTALRLSYDDLPPHMKICFAYCCVFSKGEEMSKDSLIDLWMANRFIPSQGDVSLYVLGEEIFSCLVRRSFLQDVFEKDIYTGEICKMHDLMYDLAQYEMRHDCAVIVGI